MLFVGETPTDIYSKLLENRKIFLYEEITPELAKQVIAQLIYLDAHNCEPISLYISSRGGCVTSGLSIIDTMHFIKSDVYTYNLGECASMAAWILAFGKEGHRYSLKHGEVMLHQISTKYEGNIQDIDISHRRTMSLNETMLNLLSEKVNIDKEDLKEKLKRDWFLSAEESVEIGIIDAVVDIEE